MQGRMAVGSVDLLRKMVYADDFVIIAESKQELQEVVEEWKRVFKKHGLILSLEKTEVMWVGQQSEELTISLNGKEIKQVQGHSEVDVRRRIQAGAKAWRNVEGVMLDRNIFKTLKVLSARVTPACRYGVETVALTEQ